MPQGYIKEASYLFSDIYHPRKWSKSWVLQSVLQVSSLESNWIILFHRVNKKSVIINSIEPCNHQQEARERGRPSLGGFIATTSRRPALGGFILVVQIKYIDNCSQPQKAISGIYIIIVGFKGWGKFPPFGPKVACLRVETAVAVPVLLSGLASVVLTCKEEKILGQHHKLHLQRLLRLPQSTFFLLAGCLPIHEPHTPEFSPLLDGSAAG